MGNIITTSLWPSAVEKQQTVEELVDVLTKQELSKDAKIEYIEALLISVNRFEKKQEIYTTNNIADSGGF